MALAPEDQPNDDPVLPMSDDVGTVETKPAVEPAAPSLPEMKKNWESVKPLVGDMTAEEVKKFNGIKIPVLADTASRINDDMEATGMGEVDVSKDSIAWYENLLESFRSSPAHGLFEKALADPDANWTNALAHNGMNINIGRPQFFNKGRGNSKLSSERVLLSIRSKLGLGAPIQVPLLGSGFYGTVKPLGEDEIIGLWREILAETVKLGRSTHGLMFSNNQVFTNRSIAQAWKRTLVNTTVSDLPSDNLFDHITINDMPLIAHSVATSLYPNGFPLTRSVFTEDTKMPKEEISQLIDVRKSLVINNKLFKDEQLAHMVKRIDQPMTLKMVKEYRDQFVFNHSTVVDIGEGIKLHLYTPSLTEYFNSGEKWINEILGAVHEALGAEASVNERANLISQLAKASRLRQYAHYVKAIEEDGEMFNTRENVDKVLSGLSADDTVSRTFMKAVFEYIDNTQVALICTTSVNEYEDKLSGEKWPRLIPIDATSVFFQLVEQKLLGITSRVLEATSD